MPLIGGTSYWLGPVIGAIFLGTIQQVATVTISSALNLLIVGVLLVFFVVVAPNGVFGLFQRCDAPEAQVSEPLLRIEELGKRFGGFVALDGIDLEVARGRAASASSVPTARARARSSTASRACCATKPARCSSTAMR